MEGETPSREIRIATVLISILLAWLTYRLVETPIRFGNHSKGKAITLLVLMVVVGYAGYNSYKRDGLPFRAAPKKVETYTKSIAITERSKECFEVPFAFEKHGDWFCQLGERSSQPSIFAYGDSHALSFIPAIEKLGIANKINILFAGNSGCAPLLGVQPMRGAAWNDQYNCKKLNNRIFEHVKNSKIKSVLLIARWSYYTGGTTKPDELNFISMDEKHETTGDFSKISFEYGLKQTIEKYNNIGVRVYIFEDNPQQIYEPKDALKKSMSRFVGATDTSINQLSVTIAEHKNNQSWVSQRFENIDKEMATIVNFDHLLCGTEQCPLVYKGKFLYSDDDHLSIEGAMLVYPSLVKVLSPPHHDTSFHY